MSNDFAATLGQMVGRFKMSQYELARCSGLSPITVNRLIKGVRRPTEAQTLALAIGFERSVLLGRVLEDLQTDDGPETADVLRQATGSIPTDLLCRRSSLGPRTVEAILSSTQAPNKRQSIRLFFAALGTSRCFERANQLLDSAGYDLLPLGQM
jgi:transcriptional regulator with XRE-family HTH domain